MRDENICIVGAGTMGWSIAQTFVEAGFFVTLCDRELTFAEAGRRNIEKSLSRLVQKGRLGEKEAKEAYARVSAGLIEDAKDCTFAVEAVFENLEVKCDVLKKLESSLPAGAVFASNTSSLSITQLSNSLQNPARFAGMHFFNPPTVMKLVEIIGGEHTDEATIGRIADVTERLGKVAVRVKEGPGFIVNRILIPMINEAVGIYSEGLASREDIDNAMKYGANHPIGPLALADLVGLDICLAIMEVLHSETGDPKYRPHPYLKKMVRAGYLGKKSKKGFYKYE